MNRQKIYQITILLIVAVNAAAVARPLLSMNLNLFITHVFVEDAFYYLVPAINYHTSGIISLDGRNPTNGYHPLWMLCNIIITWIFRSRESLPFIISGFGWILSVVSTFIVCAHIKSRENIFSTLIALLAVSAVWLFGPFYYLWFNGMECATAFLSLALFLSLAGRYRKIHKGTFYLGLSLGILILARIDFVELAGLCVLVFFLVITKRDGLNTAIRETALLMSGLLVLTVPYFLINKLYFGDFATSSSLVKIFLANIRGRDGLTYLTENLSGFIKNFINEGTGGLSSSPSKEVIFGFLALVGVYGAATRIFDLVKTGNVSGYLEVTLLLFPIVHACIYAFTLGDFASDSYINWYFVPQVFVLGYSFGLGIKRIFDKNHFAGILVFAPLILGFIFYGHQRIERITNYTHVSPFVKLGLALNRVTPPGSRIMAFSAGTQAYLASDGRTVTNIDGLINSTTFFKEFIVPGRLHDYICDEINESNVYFSDNAGDLQFSPVMWPSQHGYSTVVQSNHLELLAQGPSWGSGFLNIAKISCGHTLANGPQLVAYRSGRDIGQIISTSEKGQSRIAPDDYLQGNSILLPSRAADETGNAFNYFSLEPGSYKIVVRLTPIQRKTVSDGGLFRVSFASWADSVTWGEIVFDRQRMNTLNGDFNAVVFGRVPLPNTHAEVRITNLGNGVDILIKDISIYKIKDLVD